MIAAALLLALQGAPDQSGPAALAAAAEDCVAATSNERVNAQTLIDRGWSIAYRGEIDHSPVTYFQRRGFAGRLYSASFDPLTPENKCLIEIQISSSASYPSFVAELTRRLGRPADQIRPDFFNEHRWHVGALDLDLDLNDVSEFQSAPSISISVAPRNER